MITLLILQAAMGQSVPASDSIVSSTTPVQPAIQAAAVAVTPASPDTAKPAPGVAVVVAAPESATVSAPGATKSVAPVDTTAVVVLPPPPPPPPMPTMPPMPPPPPAAVAELLPDNQFGSWQIGVAAGDAGGYGLSLRRWFSEANALQLNLAPYLRRENVPGTDDPNDRNRDLDSGFRFDASISVGLTWLHSHAEKQFNRGRVGMKVLSYLAGSGFFEVEQQQIDHKVLAADGKTKTVVFDDYYRTTQEFQLGGGGGVEFSCWRLSAYALVGLGGWYEYTSEDFGFRPDGQLGMHFRF